MIANNPVKYAKTLMKEFKGDDYTYGLNVIDKTATYAESSGKNILIIANHSNWLQPTVNEIINSLESKGINIAGDKVISGARPNAPREDVYRIEAAILQFQPDCLIAIGGGSTIDAAKAANVLASLGQYSNNIETYFGTGEVTSALEETDEELIPLVAVQTAASSAAHLTKYANVTDPVAGQKKLIVDNAIIPEKAVFDYNVTKSATKELTADGAFDGLAHSLEVFYGCNDENYDKLKQVTGLSVELIINNLQQAIEEPENDIARKALGLGTDLGGYAIMVGGTNGGHLTSFSLVDVTTHGRACAIMNSYYTVFFAPAIEPQLRVIGDIYQEAGFIDVDLDKLSGRDLGKAVAEGMIALSNSIGYPTRLIDLPQFSDKHIKRALQAAKNPQLDMKLRNMPIPLNASLVDEYMGPILEAAKTGDFDLIKMSKK